MPALREGLRQVSARMQAIWPGSADRVEPRIAVDPGRFLASKALERQSAFAAPLPIVGGVEFAPPGQELKGDR